MCYFKLFEVFQQLDEDLLGCILGCFCIFHMLDTNAIYQVRIPLKKSGKSLVLATLSITRHQFFVS